MAMAAVDNLDVVACCTSSIHHTVGWIFRNRKAAKQ